MARLQIVLSVLLAASVAVASAAASEPERDLRRDGAEAEGSEDAVGERLELYLTQHGGSARRDPVARLQKAKQEYEGRRSARAKIGAKPSAATAWVSLGPTNGAGRMTSIAPHPTLIGTVYVGAAGGGVWKTEDSGATWTPLTDDLVDLAVGALAIAPSAPDTIYLGTGEANGASGIGLLSSNDGGATWALPDAVIATAFYRISVHPDRPEELVAGTDQGGFRSTDGGRTWSRFLSTAAVTEVVRSPADPTVLYAATSPSQVWKSEDAGVTWLPRSSGIASAGVRLSLAMSPSNPQLLYAADEIDEVAHVYRSADGGQSWLDLASVWKNAAVQHFMGGIGYWANTLVVLPGQPEVVIAGGVMAIRSVDGGATWSALPGTHADFHDLRSQGSVLWIANDGGVWTSPDGGVTAVDRNAGLVTRQYYSVANDPFHPDRVLAGAQDNGSSLRTDTGTSWQRVDGGDGQTCAFSTATPDVFYMSEQYGVVHRLASAGAESPAPQTITPPYGSDEARPFYTVIALDPHTPTTLYTGSTRVWRSIDSGASWSPLPTTTRSTAWSGDGVTTIAVASSDSRVLMIGKASGVYRSADGGQTWVEADGGLPGANVNRLEIDPTDASVAYAALASTDGRSVFATFDGGAHWQSRSTGLPPFVTLAVRSDPVDPHVLYCGTEVGVFRSTDQGASWSRFGAGLPASSVQDVQISGDGSVLRIATYGRGIWELDTGRGTTSRGTPDLPCPTGSSDCPSPRTPGTIPSRH